MWRAFLCPLLVQNVAFLLVLLLSLFSCACLRRLQVISSHLFSQRLPMDLRICMYFAVSMSVIVLLDQRQSTMWCPRFNILMLIILKYTCLGAYLFKRTDLRFSPIPCLLFLFLNVHDLHTDRSVLSKDIISYIIEISRGLTRRWMLFTYGQREGKKMPACKGKGFVWSHVCLLGTKGLFCPIISCVWLGF